MSFEKFWESRFDKLEKTEKQDMDNQVDQRARLEKQKKEWKSQPDSHNEALKKSADTNLNQLRWNLWADDKEDLKRAQEQMWKIVEKAEAELTATSDTIQWTDHAEDAKQGKDFQTSQLEQQKATDKSKQESFDAARARMNEVKQAEQANKKNEQDPEKMANSLLSLEWPPSEWKIEWEKKAA